MGTLARIAVTISMLCFVSGTMSRTVLAYDRAVWTGSGGSNDVQNPLNWSWPDGGWHPGFPDDDTDVILDHTAESTTLGFSDNGWCSGNTVTVGNGTDPVAYDVVSHTDTGRWGLSFTNGFTVNDKATVDFKNGLALLPGSTLRVEKYGHLEVGCLNLNGNLELLLPAEPSGEYVVADYGQLVGEFASVTGLPPGWWIDYRAAGETEDDYYYIRVVPEPSTFALAGIGLLGLIAQVRRRRGGNWGQSQ